jgi:hypothetical protein
MLLIRKIITSNLPLEITHFWIYLSFWTWHELPQQYGGLHFLVSALIYMIWQRSSLLFCTSLGDTSKANEGSTSFLLARAAIQWQHISKWATFPLALM